MIPGTMGAIMHQGLGGPTSSAFNPADKSSNAVLSGNNAVLNNSNTGLGGANARGTLGLSSPSKKYFEFLFTSSVASDSAAGIALSSAAIGAGNAVGGVDSWALYISGGKWVISANQAVFNATSVTPAIGDRIGIAVDGSSICLSINGTFYSSAGTSIGSSPSTATFTSSGPLFPMATAYDLAQNIRLITDASLMNYLPSGYTAWG